MKEYIVPIYDDGRDDDSIFVGEIREKATEVVRCKDCKHKDVLPDVYGIGKEALYCPAIKHYVVHDFFCKYGEKVTE